MLRQGIPGRRKRGVTVLTRLRRSTTRLAEPLQGLAGTDEFIRYNQRNLFRYIFLRNTRLRDLQARIA